MAEGKDPLSMSLDDVIANSRSKSERGRGRRGRGSGSARGRSVGRERRDGRPGGLTIQVGGIQKTSSTRRGGGRDRYLQSETDEDARLKRQELDGPGLWSHNKAPSTAPARRRLPVMAAPEPSRAPVGSSKLLIANLDQNVTDEDLRELFESMGKLKSCAINYTREGQSQGTATVVFVTAASATQAINDYNGVHLDGKPMRIEQVMLAADQLSSGLKISKPAAANPRGIGGRAFSQALNSAGQESLAPSAHTGRLRQGAAMDMEL